MIPPTDGTVVFEFFEQAGPTFFNGVDTDETDCVSWYSRAAEAVGFFGVLTGLATKIPTGVTVALGAGTLILEEFLDRNACRFTNYEEMPGPEVGGTLVGNGIKISKKYYGGLSMLPQREVKSSVLLRADDCVDYRFVGSFGAEWALYASTRSAGSSTPRVHDEVPSIERQMVFPCG